MHNTVECCKFYQTSATIHAHGLSRLSPQMLQCGNHTHVYIASWYFSYLVRDRQEASVSADGCYGMNVNGCNLQGSIPEELESLRRQLVDAQHREAKQREVHAGVMERLIEAKQEKKKVQQELVSAANLGVDSMALESLGLWTSETRDSSRKSSHQRHWECEAGCSR